MAERPTISFWHRLFDLISPRRCPICGHRLAVTEDAICAPCSLHLPRTYFARDALRNEMARLLWLRMPIERAAALFYYESRSQVARVIYRMKYGGHPETAEQMGRMLARELMLNDFFEGIECIVPMPLARKRLRQRGYNQSEEIARGISEVTGLAVDTAVVERVTFHESQTRLDKWRRTENVDNAFRLHDGSRISGRHILLVDDVLTTGATVTACAKALAEAGNVRISVATLGYVKH